MSGMYFDEKRIQSAAKEYQATGDQRVLEPFTQSILKLVDGVVKRYGIWRFWDDQRELLNEGFLTALECIGRFDPTLGKTLFNYLTGAIRWRLTNFTLSHNQRVAQEVPIDDVVGAAAARDIAEDPPHRSGGVCCGDPGCLPRKAQVCASLDAALRGGAQDAPDLIASTMLGCGCSERMAKSVAECAAGRAA